MTLINTTRCLCGKGCKPNRRFYSLTNPRIHSQADADAYEASLGLTGDPAPFDLPEDTRKPSGVGPGPSAEDRAIISAGAAYFAECGQRISAGDRTVDGWVQTLYADRNRPRFSITLRMAEVLVSIRDREAARRVAAAAAPTAAPKAPAAEGWYRVGQDVYKVQIAVHGSGRPYAKRLDPESGSWEYAPGIVARLTDADRMSYEEAATMGRLYGRCMVCGRVLTDEGSIAAGIGPVCGGRLTEWMGESL